MIKSLIRFSAVFVFTSLSVFAAVPDGRIAYWSMNAITSGQVLDEVNANHLTVVGTPTVEPALVGNGLIYAGRSLYVSHDGNRDFGARRDRWHRQQFDRLTG
jgi:hypothetical protein